MEPWWLAIPGCLLWFVILVLPWRPWSTRESLEAELDRPVITSNSASLWAALRHMGVDGSGQGSGRLFERAGAAARRVA